MTIGLHTLELASALVWEKRLEAARRHWSMAPRSDLLTPEILEGRRVRRRPSGRGQAHPLAPLP